MNLKKLAMAAGALLLAASSSFAQSTAERWITRYYENPQPEAFVKNVYALSEQGYFEREAQPATSIGFFAAVFAQNPDRVGDWMARAADLPVAHQRLLAAGLWYSGDRRGQAWLARLANEAKPETRREIQRLLAQGPQRVGDTPVRSASSMNLQWGSFLASGEEVYVTNILAAVGSGAAIDEGARSAFAFNASEHERVREIFRAQLDKQPNEVRSLLRAVLAEPARANGRSS